jgi:hypothetical protein
MFPIQTDSMQPVSIEASPDLAPGMPSTVHSRIPMMSDDECLRRLAQTVREQDSNHLDELAQLIGRLAVIIE